MRKYCQWEVVNEVIVSSLNTFYYNIKTDFIKCFSVISVYNSIQTQFPRTRHNTSVSSIGALNVVFSVFHTDLMLMEISSGQTLFLASKIITIIIQSNKVKQNTCTQKERKNPNFEIKNKVVVILLPFFTNYNVRILH